MRRTLVLLLFVISGHTIWAQGDFYAIDSVREIRMYFSQPNWDHILDSLYVDGDEHRLLGDVMIEGTLIQNVGIRYKGFSSVSTERKKNPFNIKLDYITNDDYRGIEKIKLSNVIQDPSFVREALSYEIARNYLPSGRANFANVYINDTLWGLYTNVEPVNKDFVDLHYRTRDNAFFKCNPAHLDLFGENANLGDHPGTDTTDYYPFYELKSDNGWGELYSLIDVLNNNVGQIENVLNVDRALWMHAFNYALVNFDSYIGYAQNYYLYQDEHGIFQPILWDMNMSFGSFRLSDASDFWDGFTVDQAKTIDPLAHHNSVSVQERPFIRNLMSNDTYRRMYMAHIRTIVEEYFANGDYYTRGTSMQNLIDPHVLADTNKFYGYDDFSENLDTTVSDLIVYPGIKDLMDNRSTYLASYPGYQGAPQISNIQNTPGLITGSTITFTAEVTDAEDVWLYFRPGGTGPFSWVTMLDDGANNDGAAGDGVYGVGLALVPNALDYYFYAENDSAGRFLPERAAYEFYSLEDANLNFQTIVINEVMADNGNVVKDQDGEYDDWIELYNPNDYAINLGNFFLSDKIDTLNKWRFPDVSIEAHGYAIVWADKQEGQDGLHANFRLSASGEAVYLTREDTSFIDSVSFGPQAKNISYARSPNGFGAFTSLLPTFAGNNDFAGIESPELETKLSIYPNPTDSWVSITWDEEAQPTHLKVLDIEGRTLLLDNNLNAPQNLYQLQTENWPAGAYIVQVGFTDKKISSPLFILR